MWNHECRRGGFGGAARAVLLIAVMLSAGGSSLAGEGKWTLFIEPTLTEPYGHDQHILTVREIDLDGSPPVDNKTAATLEPDGGVMERLGVRYERGQWSWGIDVALFLTSQLVNDRTAAAEGVGGTIDEVVFEIADQSFTSTDPSEVLFYNRLEDTDMELWTFDLYGMKTLAEKPESEVKLQFGLRFGDFDNDYFAVVGIENDSGRFLGSSSNYDRMMGPIVGLAGEIRRGRNTIHAYIGQSVLIGTASLLNTSEDFTGPVATPVFVDREEFQKRQDVAIPITEFRVKWTYRISKTVALGAGTYTSAWWDVPVPPGIVPGEDGDQVFHENTIVLFGLVAAVELTF